jgi:DNA-binding protein WhiA
VNDPQKNYHLEFSLPAAMEERLSALYAFMLRNGFTPKRVSRSTRNGIYFKGNGVISDVLYWIGAVKAGFDFANGCIEKDIRNYENRATNCVATNISKSVGASQKHIAAIRRLERAGQLQALPDELYETAILRLLHEDATLSELALLHQPPISKSGLNHRLQKICSFAETVTPVI